MRVVRREKSLIQWPQLRGYKNMMLLLSEMGNRMTEDRRLSKHKKKI